MRFGRWGIGIILVCTLIAGVLAQAMPEVSAQEDPTTVIARGLTTPGGFTWNANDTLFVALTGSGGGEIVQPDVPAPLGPVTFGDTGAIAIIDDGCPTPLATGIVSYRSAQNHLFGVQAVTELNGQLYALISNAGDQTGDHEQSSGVYRIGGDGGLNLVADHGAFLRSNPPAVEPAEELPNSGDPVAMLSDSTSLWIADRLNGLVSRITPGEDETLVADLSSEGWLPTDLAFGAGGALYASVLDAASSEPGSAGVIEISTGGSIELVWSDLTMISGVAIANDGVLYATELAAGTTPDIPAGIPDSGRLVRQSDNGFEVIVDGIDAPSALGTGSDGAVYFVTGAIDSSAGTGTIVRYAPDGTTVDAAPSDCPPIAETLNDAPIPTPVPTGPTAIPTETPIPTQTPIPTEIPLPTPTVPWDPNNAAPTGDIVEVRVYEYEIDMPTMLSAGPVTFVVTNYGSLAHSFAIEGPGVDTQLNFELQPGEEGALTVDLQPGVYAVTSPSPGDRDNGMSIVLTVA